MIQLFLFLISRTEYLNQLQVFLYYLYGLYLLRYFKTLFPLKLAIF